eukprot:Gb_39911 [translate_table: standard]
MEASLLHHEHIYRLLLALLGFGSSVRGGKALADCMGKQALLHGHRPSIERWHLWIMTWQRRNYGWQLGLVSPSFSGGSLRPGGGITFWTSAVSLECASGSLVFQLTQDPMKCAACCARKILCVLGGLLWQMQLRQDDWPVAACLKASPDWLWC